MRPWAISFDAPEVFQILVNLRIEGIVIEGLARATVMLRSRSEVAVIIDDLVAVTPGVVFAVLLVAFVEMKETRSESDRTLEVVDVKI